ncbi:MAG: LamG domain-containing protein, partial [Bacteroidetes bacterium]|nr:LamG domain-containing protein [Bacteroidota bacterium]
MKNQVLLIFSVIFNFLGVSYAQMPCHVAQYNFSGNANDSKGTNHGTVSNATLTADRFGNANSAYLFSASSSSYIQIPYNNFFLPNYTYSVWIKPTVIPTSPNFTMIMSIGGLGGDQNMQLFNASNGGTLGTLTGLGLTAYQKSGSTISVGGAVDGSLPSTNRWYHLVVTRDSNYYRIYLDGCLKATSSSTSGALPYYGGSNFDARIGCRERGSWYFDGAIDDVGIYSCALSAAEVTKLYNNLKPLQLTKDTTICRDNFTQFKLKAPRTYCSYRWVNVANPSSVLSTDSHLLINITSTTTYRCVTNSRDTAFVKVTIIQRPIVKLGNDTFFCGKVSKTLDAGPKARSYLWDDNSTSRYRTVNDSGKFRVRYTDSFGCFASDTIWLRIHPLPKFDLGPDTHYCNSFSRVLYSIPNVESYTWNTNDTTQSITIDSSGLYWVKAIDSNACIFIDSILIDNPKTYAGFSYTILDSCLNTNKLILKDTSRLLGNSKVRNTFFFGDNSSQISDSLLKIYSGSGNFKIKQHILTDKNCQDSSFLTVNIWSNAQLRFNINSPLQCYNNHSFNFVNTSSVSEGNLMYQWDLGDGSSDTSKSVFDKSYPIDSTYLVS